MYVCLIYIYILLGHSRKDPYSPTEEMCVVGMEGKNFISNNGKCIGSFKGGGGQLSISSFACGGGMDVFCYDPFYQIYTFLYIHTI